MKKWWLFFLICGLFFFLLSYPAQALSASRQGMDLWLNTLLPTLLPAMILSNLFIESGLLTQIFSRKSLPHVSLYAIYVSVLGLLCGYPMGAKLCKDLYVKEKLTRKEATFLLTFCNNPSPMFLSGYVLFHCLDKKDWILPSFFILYLADFLCAVLFAVLLFKTPFFSNCLSNAPKKNISVNQEPDSDTKMEKSTSNTISAYIDLSIMNGFEAITKMGGYILLFSLCAAMINHFWPIHLPGKIFFLGILEISTGLLELTSQDLPLQILYPVTMGLTAFGGLCTLAQTKGILAESNLSLFIYILSKCVCAFMTMFLALIFVIQIV